MSAVRGLGFSPRVAGWAGCSVVVVVLVGGGVASLVSIAVGTDAFPMWGQPSWWAAAVVFALVLGLGCGWFRPTIRRFLFTSIGAAVAYLAVGSALLTVGYTRTADPDVAGSSWLSAMQGAAVFALRIDGNGAVAFVAPLALGLLAPFRPALLGRPARWSNRVSTQADEDAAAEDFTVS